jgi:hypothetical protein
MRDELKKLIGTPLDEVPEDVYESISSIDRDNHKVTTNDGFTLVIDRDPLDWGDDEDLDMYLGNIIDVYQTPGYTPKPVEVYEENKPSVIDLLNLVGKHHFNVKLPYGVSYDNIIVDCANIVGIITSDISLTLEEMDNVLSNPKEHSDYEVALYLAFWARLNTNDTFYEDSDKVYQTTPEMLMNIVSVYKDCKYLDAAAAVGLAMNKYIISK